MHCNGLHVDIYLKLKMFNKAKKINFSYVVLLIITLIVCDVIPFPKGGRIYPMFILVMAGLLLAPMFSKNFSLDAKLFPVIFPILLHIAFIIWGYFYGVYIMGNYDVYALSEAQAIVAWIFLPATLIVFGKSNFEEISKFMALIGFVVAGMTIFQFVTGLSFGARVEDLETLGGAEYGITRATIPAKLFVLYCLFIQITYLVRSEKINRQSFFNVLKIALLSAALFVSFGRALWGGAVVGVFLTAAFLGGRQFIVTFLYFIVAMLIASVLMYFLAPNFAAATLERAISVFYEGDENSSLGWRFIENINATAAIEDSPLLGIGLGGEYKPPMVDPLLFPSQTSYIHNSYYMLMMKLGFVGIFIPIFVVGIATVGSLRLIFSLVTTEYKVLVASGLSTVWVMVLLSFTQPEWSTMSSICFLAYFFALVSKMNAPATIPSLRRN